MRIPDRLRRLEVTRDAGGRMELGEIRDAEARFDDSLAIFQPPPTTTAAQLRAGWRACVDAPGPGWRQRLFANMDPEDFFV